MEHTRSFTEDSVRSLASRFTVSLVSPICSRKDTPWKEPREFVGLGTLWLPLDSRVYSGPGGLGDGDGVDVEDGWCG